MADARASIVIDRPVPAVWAVATDLARTPEWRTTVTSVEPPPELASGERFRATTRLLGRRWTWALELTAVDHERRFAYRVVEGFTDLEVAYLLEPKGDGCRFTMTGTSSSRGVVARAVEPLAARALRRQLDQQLANLRRLVESSG